MKHRMPPRFAAVILAVLLTLTLAACKGEEPEQLPTAEQNTPAPTEADEPEEEEVALSVDPAANTGKEDPKPEKENGPLPDGEYLVKLERTQTVDPDGTVRASFIRQQYVELPNAEIAGLKTGDTVQLPAYSFVIESMQTEDSMGCREIRFNDGTERCFYVEETDTWRFTWPNDEPYLIDGEHGALPLAVDVILTDELTPLSEGRSVYGVPYDGNDPTIGALDLIEDFFNHHSGLEWAYATITVRGGEIAGILIEYHP